MSTKTQGFQLRFIADELLVAFPTLHPSQVDDLVIADPKKTGELIYPHFSVFLSRSRRFPFFTATNIDGKLFKKIPRKSIFPGGSDQWSIDSRVSDFQWGSHLYSAPKSDFQRGQRRYKKCSIIKGSRSSTKAPCPKCYCWVISKTIIFQA